METLSANNLYNLIQSVFPHFPEDRFLGILVDYPRNPVDDTPEWRARRSLAEEWAAHLKKNLNDLDLDGVRLLVYPDVGSNNAELPPHAYLVWRTLPASITELEENAIKIAFSEIFKKIQVFLAPTQFSTTAPLKNAAKTYRFRAATMPGFSPEMIPTLKLDYAEVNRRVMLIKERLDKALSATVEFLVDGRESHRMLFDLRFRSAHASTGRFPEKGTAGNLPSGEAYIVPYEGERGEASLTEGILPVQIDQDLILFTIKENRAVEVAGEGLAAEKEDVRLRQEPAYGNMAELGFGVLHDFGIAPAGKILLDEKLGFHIAFGRSEHFGGRVGPSDFSSPEKVVHLDRIYIPDSQPRIRIKSVMLQYEGAQVESVMENGGYRIF